MLLRNAESLQHPMRSYSAGGAGDGGTAQDPAPALSAGPQNCSFQPHQHVIVGVPITMLYQMQAWGSKGVFDNISRRNSKRIFYHILKGGEKMFWLVIL